MILKVFQKNSIYKSMEIKYLNKILENPNLKSWSIEGLSLAKIKELEALYNKGKPFPTSIREFLWLSGKDNNIGFNDHPNMFELQIECRRGLDVCEQVISRPFLAFDNLNACEQFGFVYLDEDQNDPDVYWAPPYYAADYEGHPLIIRYDDYTFSSLVNEHIYRLKNGLGLD